MSSYQDGNMYQMQSSLRILMSRPTLYDIITRSSSHDNSWSVMSMAAESASLLPSGSDPSRLAERPSKYRSRKPRKPTLQGSKKHTASSVNSDLKKQSIEQEEHPTETTERDNDLSLSKNPNGYQMLQTPKTSNKFTDAQEHVVATTSSQGALKSAMEQGSFLLQDKDSWTKSGVIGASMRKLGESAKTAKSSLIFVSGNIMSKLLPERRSRPQLRVPPQSQPIPQLFSSESDMSNTKLTKLSSVYHSSSYECEDPSDDNEGTTSHDKNSRPPKKFLLLRVIGQINKNKKLTISEREEPQKSIVSNAGIYVVSTASDHENQGRLEQEQERVDYVRPQSISGEESAPKIARDVFLSPGKEDGQGAKPTSNVSQQPNLSRTSTSTTTNRETNDPGNCDSDLEMAKIFTSTTVKSSACDDSLQISAPRTCSTKASTVEAEDGSILDKEEEKLRQLLEISSRRTSNGESLYNGENLVANNHLVNSHRALRRKTLTKKPFSQRKNQKQQKTKALSVETVEEHFASNNKFLTVYEPTPKHDSARMAVWNVGIQKPLGPQGPRQLLTAVSDAILSEWLEYATEAIKEARGQNDAMTVTLLDKLEMRVDTDDDAGPKPVSSITAGLRGLKIRTKERHASSDQETSKAEPNEPVILQQQIDKAPSTGVVDNQDCDEVVQVEVENGGDRAGFDNSTPTEYEGRVAQKANSESEEIATSLADTPSGEVENVRNATNFEFLLNCIEAACSGIAFEKKQNSLLDSDFGDQGNKYRSQEL